MPKSVREGRCWHKVQSYVLSPIKRSIACGLWRVIRALKEPQAKPVESQLPDLSPTTYAENIEVPAKALDEYLQRSSIHEIAITSPYSGGKSSFILSYFKLRYFYKVKYVSLAAFLEQARTQSGERSGELKNLQHIDLRDIEISLLQQISQQPRLEPRRSQGLLYSMVVLVATVTGLYLHHHHYAFESLLLSLHWASFPGCVQLLFASTTLASAVLLIKDLYCLIDRQEIRKINLFKVGLELDASKTASILNQHMREILNSFLVNNVDVVVFEDLDRFKREEIFIKLKELNKHINDCEQVGRTVRFIYAIGDDVFERYNRTKFFDAIIPIIPATNTHKSSSHLKHLVKTRLGNDSYEDLKELIDSIALYVVDMRLLNSIVADYAITLDTLLKTNPKVDKKKLFGFIVYKNYFPDDFAKLHNKEGIFYALTCYDSIKAFRQTKLADHKLRKEELTALIKVAEVEHLEKISELKIVVLMRALERHQLSLFLVRSVNNQPVSTFLNKDWPGILNQEILVLENNNYQKNITLFEGGTNDQKIYLNRLRIIERKDTIHSLEIELKELENKMALIMRLPLKQFILEDATFINIHLNAHKVLDTVRGKMPVIPSLLRVLLLHEYLDEHYMLYTNHCHPEDDITGADLSFLQAVKERMEFGIDKPLSKIKVIIEKMTTDDFDSPAVINYKFIDYLMDNHPEFLSQVFQSVVHRTDAMKICYDLWYKSGNHRKMHYASWLSKNNNNICEELVRENGLTEGQKRSFLVSLMSETIKLNDGKRALQLASAELEPFLSSQNYLFAESKKVYIYNITQLFSQWKDMGVKFSDLEVCLHDKDYMDNCLDHNVYILNPLNVKAISQHLGLNVNSAGSPDYSDIKKLSNHFSERLDSSIVEVVQLMSAGVITISDEDDVINILNRTELDAENRVDFIEKADFTIEHIDQIDSDFNLYPALIANNRLSINWQTVTQIKDTLGVDDCIPILETRYEALCDEIRDKDDEVRSVIDNWVPLDSLSLVAFSAYIKALDFYKDSIAEFNHDQIKFLLNNDYLDLSSSVLNELDNDYPDFAIAFINRNIDKLLEKDVFTDGLKISRDLLLAIIQYCSIDLDEKQAIYHSQAEYVNDAFWDEIPKLEPEIYEQFMAILEGSDRTIKLLLSQIPHASKAQLEEMIIVFDDGLKLVFSDQKTCTVDHSPQREAVLQALKDEGVISDYKVDEREQGSKLKVTLNKGKVNDV